MSQVCSLEYFGFIRVSGKEAIKFLQGYTTCNLDRLDGGQVLPGAVCNIQGRMITSFLIAKRPDPNGQDELILRMHRPLVPKTIEFLNQYIVFSKASLADISESLRCYGVLACGQVATGTCDIDGADVTVNLDDRQELWVAGEQVVNAPVSDWCLAEVEAGRAWVQEATSEQFLPQMFNYHNTGAIDFDKGCYLGQEIVARMQYRGALKRRLYRLSSGQLRDVGCSVKEGIIVGSSQGEGACRLLAVLQVPRGGPDDQAGDSGSAQCAGDWC